MHPAPTQPTVTTTFVVRFWHEWADGTARWRGRVEHIESGQQVYFLEIEGLLGFFGRFGIGMNATPTGRTQEDPDVSAQS